MHNPGRTIELNLRTIVPAQCMLDAVAHLVMWAYTSGDIDERQAYDRINMYQEYRTNNICASYTSSNTDKRYFITAVFDEDTKKYSFHS